MPSLRDQLQARRTTYLERIAVFDSLNCKEPYDIRPVMTRGFLEGGDDISPKCEADGVKVQRRRLPSNIAPPEKDAAGKRLEDGKTAPSGPGDWDAILWVRDVDGGWGGQGETNLYRITAQLVRATEYFQAGITIPFAQVLDLITSELPNPADTDKSVQKAWHLLLICGANLWALPRSYWHLIEDIGPVVTNANFDVAGAIPMVVTFWLTSFQRAAMSTDGQACPHSADLPEREWNEACPCQRKPPEKTKGTTVSSPSLESAMLDARAALAAASIPSPQTIVGEFRSIETTDALLAQIFIWLKERWDLVPPDYAKLITSPNFHPRRPAPDADPTVEPPLTETEMRLNAYFDAWVKDVDTLRRLRAVPQFFMSLSGKTVASVCAELIKAMWPDEDNTPYGKDDLDAFRYQAR